jgi:hypothetical protein
MEKAFAKAEQLAASVKEYVNNRIESVKLNAAEKTSTVIANLAAGAVVVLVFTLFIVFASVALSVGLGAWMGKTWAGFAIVAFLYLLIGFIVWKARVKIIRLPVLNALIRQLFTSDDEED